MKTVGERPAKEPLLEVADLVVSYGAIQAALIHYSKGLSNQLIAKGIRVNAV